MTFGDCVVAALESPEFVSQWARLRGVTPPQSPIELAIDQATGHDAEIAQMFLADVFDLVYMRVQR